jgi:hypothetical protein
MKKNILVAGCSFTDGQDWPRMLFTNANIKNIGRGGAGNEYIGLATIDAIRLSNNLNFDFVFILWSGISRIDVTFPSSMDQTDFSNIQVKGKTSNTVTLFSGGPRWDWTRNDGNDPPVLWNYPFLDTYFKLKYKNNDRNFLIDNSTLHILNCHNFLESQNIPYKFGFIYNIFDSNLKEEPSCSKSQGYFKFINWDKFINFPPLEFGVKHDLLQDDGVHLTQEGMNIWANSIKHQFDKELS